MTEYDPKHLGPYRLEVYPLKSGYTLSLNALVGALEDAFYKDRQDGSSDISYFQKRLEREEKRKGEKLLQARAWRMLRDAMVRGDIIAHAVDDKHNLHELVPEFWSSQFANDALSTGRIEHIPLFKPSGEVVFAVNQIYSMYDYFYNRIYPRFAMYTTDVDFLQSDEEEENVIPLRKVGAPRQIDESLFLFEVIHLIATRGVPERGRGRRKEFKALAIQAYADASDGRAPGDTWARDRLNRIWHRLDGSDENDHEDGNASDPR